MLLSFVWGAHLHRLLRTLTPSLSLVRASHHLGPTPPSIPVLRLQPKLPNALYLFTWDTCSNFPHHPLQQFYHPPDPPFPSHANAWSRPTVGTSFPLDIVTWNSNGFGVTKIWAWIPPPSSEVLSKLLNLSVLHFSCLQMGLMVAIELLCEN